MKIMAVLSLVLACVSAIHAEPAQTQSDPDPSLLNRVMVRAEPIDEAYRQRFATCDSTDRFGSVSLPITRDGKTVWYGCRTDPSRLMRLSRIPQIGETGEAIVFVAKLAHDRDGSPKACDDAGPTDQCATSLMLKPTSSEPCPKPTRGAGTYCLPVDASRIPYIAIPGSAPAGINGREFQSKTGVAIGDLGMVIANGRAIPVIVADVGPAYKIGEGSTALLEALSSDGQPHTISAGVTFMIFPRTSLGRNVPADDLARLVKEKAEEAYKRMESKAN